jgi:hypothetical protein
MVSFMVQQPKCKATHYFRLGLLLLFIGLIAGIFILPFQIKGDAIARYGFMDTLVHQHQITPMRYSMVGPLFSLPLWLISSFFSDPGAVIARYNFFLFAIFLLILYLWLRNWFDQKFLLAFLLLLAFGSMFPGHLINYYGEVFSAVCLTLGSVALATHKAAIGWLLTVLAVLNTPALFVPFVLIVLYLTWESRRVRLLLLLPTALILIVLDNYIRMGNIFTVFKTYLLGDHGFHTILPYSGRIGYSYPFVLGILSILLSFGKGLIFYCSGLLLIGWAWKHISHPIERKLLILWSLTVVGLIMAYASWWSWYGGWYWGPRFFLFASVPASWLVAKLIFTARKSWLLNMVLLGFVTLSIWVGVNGVVFQLKTLDVCTANNYALEFLCWYVPEFSPLLRPFIAPTVLQLNDWLTLILFAAIWLYLMIPLGRDLFQQLKIAYQTHRPGVKLSSWKF